jgi:hypothetical protein
MGQLVVGVRFFISPPHNSTEIEQPFKVQIINGFNIPKNPLPQKPLIY